MHSYPDMYMIEEIVMTLVPMLVSGVPSMLFSLAAYVLSALAMQTLATRRGLSHAWLSWVPVLNVWIMGSLSDQYRYVVKGQVKSKRKILLVLNLLSLLFGLIMAGVCIFMVVDLMSGAMYGVLESDMAQMVMGPALSVVGLSLPLAGVAIAAAVIRYMALYDVFTSMDPNNSVMFLVLSILFGVTEPFFLFFSRNKDGGMPPRRQEPVYEGPQQWQPQEPARERWEDDHKEYL